MNGVQGFKIEALPVEQYRQPAESAELGSVACKALETETTESLNKYVDPFCSKQDYRF